MIPCSIEGSLEREKEREIEGEIEGRKLWVLNLERHQLSDIGL